MKLRELSNELERILEEYPRAGNIDVMVAYGTLEVSELEAVVIRDDRQLPVEVKVGIYRLLGEPYPMYAKNTYLMLYTGRPERCE